MGQWAACPHMPHRSVAASDDVWRIEMTCAFPGPTSTCCCSWLSVFTARAQNRPNLRCHPSPWSWCWVQVGRRMQFLSCETECRLINRCRLQYKSNVVVKLIAVPPPSPLAAASATDDADDDSDADALISPQSSLFWNPLTYQPRVISQSQQQLRTV